MVDDHRANIHKGAAEIASEMQSSKNFDQLYQRLSHDVLSMDPKEFVQMCQEAQGLNKNGQLNLDVKTGSNGLPDVTLTDDSSIANRLSHLFGGAEKHIQAQAHAFGNSEATLDAVIDEASGARRYIEEQ